MKDRRLGTEKTKTQREMKPNRVRSCEKATCGSRSTDHEVGTRCQSRENRPNTVSELLVDRETLRRLGLLDREAPPPMIPCASMSSSPLKCAPTQVSGMLTWSSSPELRDMTGRRTEGRGDEVPFSTWLLHQALLERDTSDADMLVLTSEALLAAKVS